MFPVSCPFSMAWRVIPENEFGKGQGSGRRCVSSGTTGTICLLGSQLSSFGLATHFRFGSGSECSPFRLDDVVELITRGGVDTATSTSHDSTDHSSARVSSLRAE